MSEKMYEKYLNTWEFDCVLPGSGKKIKYKPITLGQLKMLTPLYSVEDQEEIEEQLDNLLTECVISDNFDVDSLIIDDRLFLLLEMRKNSSGSNYQSVIKCDSDRTIKNPETGREEVFPCNSEFINNVDLNDFKITKLDKRLSKKVKINDNISLILRHNTRSDQKEIAAFRNSAIKGIKNQFSDDPTKDEIELMEKEITKINIESSMLYLALGIDTIVIHTKDKDVTEKDLDLDDKTKILNSLTEQEYDKITKWQEDNEFGYKLKTKSKCPHCGNEEEREVPIDTFFI